MPNVFAIDLIIGLTFDENLATLSLLKGSSVPKLSSSESPFRRGLIRGMTNSAFFLDVPSFSPLFFEFFAFACLLDFPEIPKGLLLFN